MILYLENCAILMLPVDHIKNDFSIFVALSHGKLDLSSFFMAGPKRSRFCCTYMLHAGCVHMTFEKRLFYTNISSAASEMRERKLGVRPGCKVTLLSARAE